MRDQNATSFIYRDLFFLILLVSLFYNIGLGHYSLFTPDEGRYSEVAREMVATGDYVTPRLNGVVFLDKPILYYWLQAASIRLFGLSEWALRFFPMLAGVLLTVATYLFGRHIFDRRAGLLAAAILATSPLIFGAAHYANLDLEVAFFITVSMYLGMLALCRSSATTIALYGCAITSGLSVLTKGLIGVFFPGFILGVMFVYLKGWQRISLKQLIISLLLFLVTVLPWYIVVQIENPQFFHYFFVTQHVTRFLSQAEFNNKIPMWFYIPVILVGCFPWCLFLYHAMKSALIHIIQDATKRAILVFLVLHSFTVFIFFSLPHSKMVGYILPVFPPLSLLIGWYLSTNWDYLMGMRYRYRAFLALLVGTALFLLSLPFVVPMINMHSSKSLVSTLKSHLSANSEVVTYFDYFYDLPLYLGKTVTVVANWQDPKLMQRDNWRRELALFAPFQDVSHVLINKETFFKKWHSHLPLFVLMSTSDFVSFKKVVSQYQLIDQTNDIVLITNQVSSHNKAI